MIAVGSKYQEWSSAELRVALTAGEVFLFILSVVVCFFHTCLQAWVKGMQVDVWHFFDILLVLLLNSNGDCL